MGVTVIGTDHRSAVDLWHSARKLIFFCGSGVSLFAPSGFPTGWRLVQTCYQSLERQLRSAGHSDAKLEGLSRLPFETLLGFVVEDISDPFYELTLSDIATYFRDATPNRLHFLVSSFLRGRKDCHVITTNYDTGFETALSQLQSFGVPTGPTSAVSVYGAESLEKARADDTNLILKIHGCAALDRPQNLVLTTEQESSGLPPSFLATLRSLFEDALVVFLGYSLSEPDCLDALLSVSGFDVMWADRDYASFEGNFRAQIIAGRARKAYFLENLIPFVELLWKDIHPALGASYFGGLDDPPMRTPFSAGRERHEQEGLSLFERLTEVQSEERLIKALVLGYSHLRDFREVDVYLNEYAALPGHSEFDYYVWKASIIRDKNLNWREARYYFELAANLSHVTPLQKSSAQSMQYGLESPIYQDDAARLREVESKLKALVAYVRGQLSGCPPAERLKWLSVLGRTQKNLVQSRSYQKGLSVDALKESIGLCEEAIRNLTESRDIHGKVETERLMARVYFRIYQITKDESLLDAALTNSERAVRFFSLLSGSMGIANAKRQYALMLMKAKRFDEARSEIQELNLLLRDSPDTLSQIKVKALETYLYYCQRNMFMLARSTFELVRRSFSFSGANPGWGNFVLAIKWYASWLRGAAG
jgi:SIR2-like domain